METKPEWKQIGISFLAVSMMTVAIIILESLNIPLFIIIFVGILCYAGIDDHARVLLRTMGLMT
jgi:Na+/glutamate symporter